MYNFRHHTLFCWGNHKSKVDPYCEEDNLHNQGPEGQDREDGTEREGNIDEHGGGCDCGGDVLDVPGKAENRDHKKKLKRAYNERNPGPIRIGHRRQSRLDKVSSST